MYSIIGRNRDENEISNTINADRHALQDVLPLKTSYAVFIDVCNACNFNCKFCAAKHEKDRRGFAPGAMSLGLFQKIIADLAKFGEKLKILKLYGLGEPLPEMVRYAKVANIADFIETVTDKNILSPKLKLLFIPLLCFAYLYVFSG